MSAPSHGTMITNRIHSAFAQPDRSSLRKMSVMIENNSQIQAMNRKNQSIVQNRSRSGMTVTSAG